MTRVADTIRERVALPYWIQGNEQHLTAAIGESMYPHDGSSAPKYCCIGRTRQCIV